jgi:hypothetical protein
MKEIAKDFFPGSALASKQSFFCCLNWQFSAISRVVVVLVTIVTPHVGPLMILRRLAYSAGNSFLLSTGSEERLGPLVHLIFSKFSNRLK